MLGPIRIDNRINGFLGKPSGTGRRPAVIHLHERYGIVEHTTDLGEKFLDAGYVTIVPDLFSRFTGDRQALARGEEHTDLSDEEVLRDIDAVVDYQRALPEVDAGKIAMSGVCQTGRQPLLVSAKRNYLSAASSCTARFTRMIGSPTRSARSPSINYWQPYLARL